MRVIIEATDSSEKKQLALALQANGFADVEYEISSDKEARFASALKKVVGEKIFKNKYDHAWIMELVNEKSGEFGMSFNGPQEYVDYIGMIEGIKDLPSADSIRKKKDVILNKFPDWKFADVINRIEEIRRINIAKRFLKLFRQKNM